jgi:CubicO group peptidase (beta-lactamase class C family)
VAIVLAALAGCTTTLTRDTAATTPPTTDAEAIDRLFSSYDRPGVPGAAVVVIKNGDVVFARGYGFADIENRIRVTERTNFRLASLTKAFTAMAVMLLVREGRLDVDERVSGIVPEFPAYARDISIRHLLTHTSGLRAYQDLIPPGSTRQMKDRDVLALLHRTDTLLFPPGSAFRYGDTGYAILAHVVETVSRQSFASFLHDRIFAPTGMDSTVAWEPGISVVPNRALGYVVTANGYRPADHSTTSTVLGDGGVYSSARDLVAWSHALDTHRLIRPRLQDLAWSPAALSDKTTTRYGFGWFIERDAAGSHVFHHGETSGFTNYIAKYLDRRLTVVILTNRRGGALAAMAATLGTVPGFRTTSR